jgi:formylglycine-generating enzyme required for sulfatase activity
MLRRAFLATTAAVLGAGPMLSTSWGQTAPVQKVAFLVGVSKYQKDGFDNLDYCERDISELAAELRKHEFKVATLTGDEATKEAVDAWLAKVFESLAKLKKHDVALLGFSGHGVQSLVKNPNPGQPDIEDAFFCPADALKSRTDTMISISWVMRQLDELSGSSQNLVLVDACRNNPNKGAKNIDGSTAKELPSKISVLFSSSAGKRSYESHEVKHGVFTHVLLQGLRGDAANRNGQITWLNLASYAIDEVPRQTRKLLDDPQAEQEPNLLGNLVRQPVLAKVTLPVPQPPVVAPKPLAAPFTEAEARAAQRSWATYLKTEPAITNKLGMRLALIPPGEFQMGCPADEAERDSDETQHRVRITRPFWLGVYEVTQEEWHLVMGSQLSYFSSSGSGKDKVSGLDTSRFPVESVSWNDATEFCRRLSAREGQEYRLPTEAEWEYACRAGTTTAYHFGGVLNGDKANVDGNYPYGTTTKGKYLERTTRVGEYGANAFGLYDMHGNVLEWCRDWYDGQFYTSSAMADPENAKEATYRVLRGGSWGFNAWNCRSANRFRLTPAYRLNFCGLRVLCLLR